MKTIGLIGGVASGKSLVAQLFADLGAGLLDADTVGHKVLALDLVVKHTLAAKWGPEILAPDGSIDRSKVAARVFGDSEQAQADRKFLESLVHPKIAKYLAIRKVDLENSGHVAVILDAPLLLEANWRPLCDLVIFVDADRDVRLARALSRGWSADEFARREAAQWPVERKRATADILLANNRDIDSLRHSVCDVWHKYVAS